jgi:hypothetical protein
MALKFFQVAGAAGIAGVFLLSLVRPVRRWMGGVQ